VSAEFHTTNLPRKSAEYKSLFASLAPFRDYLNLYKIQTGQISREKAQNAQERKAKSQVRRQTGRCRHAGSGHTCEFQTLARQSSSRGHAQCATHAGIHITQKVLEELRHPDAPPLVRNLATAPPDWLKIHSDPEEPDQTLAALLDFYTGAKVLLQSQVDRHHILPRGQFPDRSRASADNVANIAFIIGDVNKSIGQSGPEVYLKSLKPEVLESQCIPTNKKLWAIEHAADFWAARRDILARAFNDFLKDSLPQRHLGFY